MFSHPFGLGAGGIGTDQQGGGGILGQAGAHPLDDGLGLLLHPLGVLFIQIAAAGDGGTDLHGGKVVLQVIHPEEGAGDACCPEGFGGLDVVRCIGGEEGEIRGFWYRR